MSSYPYDHITYTNWMLAQNMAILSQIPVAEISSIRGQNETLKKQCENHLKEICSLKKNLIEAEENASKLKDELEKSKTKAPEIKIPDFIKDGSTLTPTITIIRSSPPFGQQSMQKGDSSCCNPITRSDTCPFVIRKPFKSRFTLVNFKPNSDSLTPEQVSETLRGIKNINDIISLKDKWFKIRHNHVLQRLHYLINPLEKLQHMVGLDEVKNDLFKKIIYWIQNPPNVKTGCDEYLNTIITGPPGVGKTEFAKIYASVFVRLGILKTDTFTEIKRDDLVGEYLGQTAPRTRKLLESAVGGVLFLDEAYSLGNQDSVIHFQKKQLI